MSLIGSTITGSLGKQIFRLGIQALKGFGWACNLYYKSRMQIDLGEVANIYQDKYNEYFSKKSRNNEAATTF